MSSNEIKIQRSVKQEIIATLTLPEKDLAVLFGILSRTNGTLTTRLYTAMESFAWSNEAKQIIETLSERLPIVDIHSVFKGDK